MIAIRVVNGAYQGRIISLRSRQIVTLGRTTRADISFEDDPKMSGKHCEIEHLGSVAVVRDLGSTNGTFVNGNAIRDGTALSHNDHLLLGSTELIIEVQDLLPQPSLPEFDASDEDRASSAYVPQTVKIGGDSIKQFASEEISQFEPIAPPSQRVAYWDDCGEAEKTSPQTYSHATSPPLEPISNGGENKRIRPVMVSLEEPVVTIRREAPQKADLRPMSPDAISNKGNEETRVRSKMISLEEPVDAVGYFGRDRFQEEDETSSKPGLGDSNDLCDDTLQSTSSSYDSSSINFVPGSQKSRIGNLDDDVPAPVVAESITEDQASESHAREDLTAPESMPSKIAHPESVAFCERRFYSGISSFRSVERSLATIAMSPSKLLDLFASSFAVVVILHFKQVQRETPEGLEGAQPLFDWLPAVTARRYGPVVIDYDRLRSSGHCQAIDHLWGHDGCLAFLGHDKNQLLAHLCGLPRHAVPGLSSQGGFFYFCWPSVIGKVLEKMPSEVAGIIFSDSLLGVVAEIPGQPDGWQVYAPPQFADRLSELGILGPLEVDNN
jgi:hypothetical protein